MLHNNNTIKYNCRLRRGSRDNIIFTTIILVVCGMLFHVRQVHSFATVTAPCLPLKSSIGKILSFFFTYLLFITQTIILLYHKNAVDYVFSTSFLLLLYFSCHLKSRHVISSHHHLLQFEYNMTP